MFENPFTRQQSHETAETMRTTSRIREDIERMSDGTTSATKEALLDLDDAHLLMLDQELFGESDVAYRILRFGAEIDSTSAPTLIREYSTYAMSPSARDPRRNIVEALKKIIS